ncbi:MAG: hypothetical protein ACRC46_13435 [Thermoguttaceae bacterium]
MGANHSVVLLEGDHTQRLSEVMSLFGLEVTHFTDRASGLAEIWDRTNWPCKGRPRECVHKAVIMSGPWTAVLDREMSMILNVAACEECASKLGTRIIGYFVEDVSQSAGFFFYAPHKVRAINIQNDEMIENFGDVLPEEKGIPYDQLLEDGVIRIARRFGFIDAAFANPRGHSLIVEVIDPHRKAAIKQQQKSSQREDYGGSSGIYVEASGLHSLRPDSNKQKGKKPAPPPQPDKPWWKVW